MSESKTQVDTFLPTGELESTKIINWFNSSDRKWFMTHMFWSRHNSRIVETRDAKTN